MPVLLIPVIFFAVLLVGWGISRFFLSQRKHPHELTKEYAQMFQNEEGFQDISLQKAAKNNPMWISGVYKQQPFVMTVVTLNKQRRADQGSH